MKGQRTYLECKNSTGTRCYDKVFDTKQEAEQRGVLLVESGQIDSYTLVRIPDTRAFEKQLEEWGWRINTIDYDEGLVRAEIEQWTDGGVDFLMYIELDKWQYQESVRLIDPNEEVLLLWNGDATYRAVFGDLGSAYKDMNNFKTKLLTQLNIN